MTSDICDRDFDAKVARTRDRPLPSGQVTLTEAVIVFIIGLAAAVALTYKILGSDVTAIMVPIWGLSTIYPLCKRVIWAPQVVLGLTMAMCVLPPWMAVRPHSGDAGLLPASLFGAIFCWLVYIDLIYASQVSNPCLRRYTYILSSLHPSITLTCRFGSNVGLFNRIALMTKRPASSHWPFSWATI